MYHNRNNNSLEYIHNFLNPNQNPTQNQGHAHDTHIFPSISSPHPNWQSPRGSAERNGRKSWNPGLQSLLHQSQDSEMCSLCTTKQLVTSSLVESNLLFFAIKVRQLQANRKIETGMSEATLCSSSQVTSRSAYESLQAVPQVQELQQEYFDPQQQWGPSKEMLASCAALPRESMFLTLVT